MAYNSLLLPERMQRFVCGYPNPLMVQVVVIDESPVFSGRLRCGGFYHRKSIAYIDSPTNEDVLRLAGDGETGVRLRRVTWKMDGGRVSLGFFI